MYAAIFLFDLFFFFVNPKVQKYSRCNQVAILWFDVEFTLAYNSIRDKSPNSPATHWSMSRQNINKMHTFYVPKLLRCNANVIS